MTGLIRLGKVISRLRLRKGMLLLGTIASGMVVALLVYAVAWHGFSAEQTSLNDGGVWVSSTNLGLVGRENTPLKQLDLRISSPYRQGDALDVLQDGEAVIAIDDSANSVTPVEPAIGVALPHDEVPVASTSDLGLGGGVVAVADPKSGKVWATHVDPVQGAGSLDALGLTAKPLTRTGAGAMVTVSDQGTIFAASSSTRKLTDVPSDFAGFGRVSSTRLVPAPVGTIQQMTAVGQVPVWLDSHGYLGFSGHRVKVGSGAELQQPGAANADVLVATSSQLLAVSLANGRVTLVAKVAGAEPSAPVELDGCAWGLWAGQATGLLTVRCHGGRSVASTSSFPVPPGEAPSGGSGLVFRVNRSDIFINDSVTGTVWAISGSHVQKVSDWQALAPEQAQTQQAQEQVSQSTEQARPQAVSDVLGGRSGDTTVLHVLDNDKAPAGAILAIIGVENTNSQLSVQISPDRQTLLARVNQGVGPGRFIFHYTIDDGKRTDNTATGEVDFTVHAADSGHAQPQLRYGYTQQNAPVYPVAAGGTVEIPALPEWRDPAYGDPIEVVSGSARASTGIVSTTAGGELRYTAPAKFSGIATIDYSVTTGGPQNHGTVRVRVYNGLATAAPTAEPNVVSAVAGSPVTVSPLENAIPGADPVDANAHLALAAPVAPQAGLHVSTDLQDGTVTLTASRPDIYTLPFRVSYGAAAATSANVIELDVQAANSTSNIPVATPATTAVYGSSQATVDVLAGDYDPRGGLLAVTAADPQVQNDQLNVSVIDGRWIRVSSRSGTLSPATQVIDYTVSNGDATATSTLTVTQLPSIASTDDAPYAQPVQAVVRAGTSVDIPVLENDSTPSGDPVSLVVPQDGPAGAGSYALSSGSGTAYADGNAIRYVAPSTVKEPTTSTFIYGVQNSSDAAAPQSSALVTVTVEPAPGKSRPDQAPTLPELDARVVEGATVTLELPPVGNDPDGDPVTVTGIGDPSDPSAAGTEPHLGQVLSYGADTITYQAFVGKTGEDQFLYTATDPYGESSQGIVRVVVVAPGDVQPPVAVDQTVTVDPSNTLRFDVLSSDLFPAGTTPAMEPLRDPPAGVSAANGVITVKAGSYPSGTQLVIPYTATNGLSQSSANLIVNFRTGFQNPPQAGDVIAKVQPGSRTVVAQVLRRVTDIDEPQSDLSIVAVPGAPVGSIHGGTVTLPVSSEPRVWTYEVKNAAGAQAAGSIYVSGSSSQIPYLKAGAVVHVPVGGSTTFQLPGEVVTPAHGTEPWLTTDPAISAEPASALTVSAPSQQSLTIHAGQASGTADLIFQVTDEQNLRAKGAQTAIITLPVVIGNPAPVLTCPNDPITVPASGTQTLDVGAICHVWQNPDVPFKRLSYGASLAAPVQGVTVTNDGSFVHITADHATSGALGTIDLHVDGYSASAKLPLIVTALPPASMRPVPQLQDQAGKPVSVDLAPYLQSDSVPAQDFDPYIVSITPTDGGPPAQTSGTTATFTPPANEHKTFTYSIVMSDSGPGQHGDRLATQSLSIVVTTYPGTVTGLAAGTEVLSNEVELQWEAPDAGGLQITGYVVSWQGGQQSCPYTTCSIKGLQNGTTYRFTVRAVNSLGQSQHPSAAVSATPDSVPTPVTNLAVTQESDGQITYQWDRPTGDFSAVTSYLVADGSGSYQTLPSTAPVVTDTITASNGTPVDFSVQPVNGLGPDKAGAAVSDDSGIASGAPSAPSAPSVKGSNVAGGGTKAFTITWGQVSPNGRGDTYYEVLDGGQPVTCVGESQWFTATTCSVQVANDGTTHTYTVEAANEAGVPGDNQPTIEGAPSTHDSPPSAATSAQAAGEPVVPTATLTATGQTGQAQLDITAGASNGASGTITCVDSSITCSFNVGSSGGSPQKTITGLSDGQSYSVTLQYCNGGTASSTANVVPCVTSQSYTVTPYGPIGQPSIQASVSGTATTVNASVDANGGDVNLTITSSDGASHQCSGGPVGTVSCSWGESGLPYSTSYSYTATAADTSGHARASTSASANAGTTPAPPPPPPTYSEYAPGDLDDIFTDPGSGLTGNRIGAPVSVTIYCVAQGSAVADGNTNWYKLASPDSGLYVSADAFCNDGTQCTIAQLAHTPFVDTAVPAC